MTFHAKLFASVAIAASAATMALSGGALAADKVSLMVGGYEKQIYLPAKAHGSAGLFQG